MLNLHVIYSLICLAALSAGSARAQTPRAAAAAATPKDTEDPADAGPSTSGSLSESASSSESSNDKTTRIMMHGSTGVGVFQDIQVPINDEAGVRGDGTEIGQENADHMGIPLSAGLELRYHPNQSWIISVLGFDALQMRAASGPSETEEASYSRLDLGSNVRYFFPLGRTGLIAQTGLRAGARRSSFNNVSTSHFIDAALVGGSFGIGRNGTSFDVFGQVAPIATFGYSDNGILGGQQLKSSSATLSEVGSHFDYPLRRGVWLDLAAEREMAHVTIGDVSQYNAFGLNVLDAANPSRTYNLTTTLARIGLRKEF